MPKVITSKAEVIQHCRAVFMQYGYNGASVSMLAKACGIRNANLYYYFENKEALLRAILAETRHYFQTEVYLKTIESDLPSEELLTAVLKAYKDAFVRFNGSIFHQILAETATSGWFNKEIQGFYSDWQEQLAELYSLNTVDMESAKQKAHATIRDIEGALVFYKLNGDVSQLDKAVEASLYR